ncbi:MAG: translation elongation factor Ts [Anaerolineae bacterium]
MCVTTDMIKQLREETGAGVLDCKKALEATDCDFDRAVARLREKGLAAAAKKADREANEGIVYAEVNAEGSLGALIEVNCETDFVARTQDFQALVKGLSRQVLAQPELDNVEALLQAPYIGNSEKTVQQALTDTIAKLGENMGIRHVARFVAGDNGLIDGYVHPGSRIGVLVEVGSENGLPDSDSLRVLAHDLALQVAAARPRYLTPADVPDDVLGARQNTYQAQAEAENKPEEIKARIIEGKLRKWYEEVCLLQQPFIKDDALTIEKLLANTSKELGVQVSIRRFARFELDISG